MATTYTADAAAAATVSEEMSTTSRNLQTLVDEMNQTLVQNLLDWDDDAKNAYTAAQAKWNTAATNMWTQLSAAQAALDSIMAGYKKATSTGVAVFS